MFKIELERTFIAHTQDSFMDIIETLAFDLHSKCIHCTFIFDDKDIFLFALIKKGLDKGVEKISFTDGKIFN
ncbi:hypothetical protein GNP80_09595 [Aliivibrio fischeri]|uniref:hypothetical protein n=1 Tax=Aliivibrio fischeri TaxID=668 RepID=UPI0007C54D1F|nr:hypothetical protein [Aliivibrio fischeri]MUK92696.1 hypothetical protein [Aliivibrio fischeri]